jgi:hypothetical protein
MEISSWIDPVRVVSEFDSEAGAGYQIHLLAGFLPGNDPADPNRRLARLEAYQAQGSAL